VTQAAPTAQAVTARVQRCPEALPQTLANLEIVFDMLSGYNKGLGDTRAAAAGRCIAQTVRRPSRLGALDFALTIIPAARLSDRVPACQPMAVPADTSQAPLPSGLYLQDPERHPVERGPRCA